MDVVWSRSTFAVVMEPALFEKHLNYLQEKAYSVIDIAELIRRIRSGERLPRKTISVTFDDGWRDNYELAFPIIKRYGFPVTIFLASGRLWPDGDVFALKRVTMTYRSAQRLVLTASLSGYYVYYKELRSGNKGYILADRSKKPGEG